VGDRAEEPPEEVACRWPAPPVTPQLHREGRGDECRDDGDVADERLAHGPRVGVNPTAPAPLRLSPPKNYAVPDSGGARSDRTAVAPLSHLAPDRPGDSGAGWSGKSEPSPTRKAA